MAVLWLRPDTTTNCKCGEANVPLDGARTKVIYLFVVQGTLALCKRSQKITF